MTVRKMTVILMILTVYVTEQVFLSVKPRTSRLRNSGITYRTPNIFSVLLLDYIQQFHTNGVLTTQFRL